MCSSLSQNLISKSIRPRLSKNRKYFIVVIIVAVVAIYGTISGVYKTNPKIDVQKID